MRWLISIHQRPRPLNIRQTTYRYAAAYHPTQTNRRIGNCTLDNTQRVVENEGSFWSSPVLLQINIPHTPFSLSSTPRPPTTIQGQSTTPDIQHGQQQQTQEATSPPAFHPRQQQYQPSPRVLRPRPTALHPPTPKETRVLPPSTLHPATTAPTFHASSIHTSVPSPPPSKETRVSSAPRPPPSIPRLHPRGPRATGSTSFKSLPFPPSPLHEHLLSLASTSTPAPTAPLLHEHLPPGHPSWLCAKDCDKKKI